MPDFGARVVEFENARCTAQSDDAIRVQLEDRDGSIWFPQSNVDDASEVLKTGDTGTLIVSEWIATKKGLV